MGKAGGSNRRMPPTRKFGRGYRRDDRDLALSAPQTARQSKCWNAWRSYFDQGSKPHCCGYAGTHLLDASPYRQYVDPDGLYHLAKHYDEWRGEAYDGTSVRAVMKVLKLLGFIREYRRAGTAEAVGRHVLAKGPVVVGTNWYAGMAILGAGGVMKPRGVLLGGHAYLVRGFNRRTGLFRIKNNYGRDWGLGGDAYIEFDDLGRLLGEDGEAWAGIERNLESF